MLENTPEEGDRPVTENRVDTQGEFLSSAEHEKFCMNQRGPSRKAKYYRETDSEPVP